MKSTVTSLMASFILVLIVTTLVLEGRNTPGAVQAFFNLLSGSSKTLLGFQTAKRTEMDINNG